MSEEPEYEVETVTQAKLVKKPGRGKSLIWKYRVKWKGYSTDEDTWEPEESFGGSTKILDQFWERANTGGRDYRNISLFKLNEEILTIGPPRRKAKRAEPSKSPEAPDPAVHSPVAASSKRRYGSLEVVDATEDEPIRPPKRARAKSPEVVVISEEAVNKKRGRPRKQPENPPVTPRRNSSRKSAKPAPDPTPAASSSRKRARKPSPEIVPATSEEDDDDSDIEITGPVTNASISATQGSKDVAMSSNGEKDAAPASRVLPLHRARAANPRVKMVDAFDALGDQPMLSAKAKAIGGANQTKRQKPGPGRSSMGLKNAGSPGKRARKHNKQEEEEEEEEEEIINNVQDPAPPTAAELLALANLNEEDCHELVDFEDDVGATAAEKEQEEKITEETIPPTTESASTARPRMPWRQSTIFGPLASGSDTLNHGTGSADSISFVLNIASVYLPVLFVDISQDSSPTLDSVLKPGIKALSGIFYSDDRAQAVLNTMRFAGSAARVLPSPDATDEQKALFENVQSNLKGNSVMVTTVETQMLVLCSSDTEVAQRFNLPQSLSNAKGILVSHATISNHSKYMAAIES
ncbi:hypothetical protein C8J56DRAFT_959515 [Mycena floridula]|nr:hypothetical protein C8J56DRAFT_959515 [Mycena floridula]